MFGVDAKTNERLQKQRMIMHGNLRSNSCREQKRKTKVVRINRNSAKSASFSSGTIEQSKYAQIPLLDAASIEQKIGKRVQSAACINQVKGDSTVIPIGDFNGCDNDEDDDGNANNKDANGDNVYIAIDESTTKDEQSSKQTLSNGCVASNVMNFISNCTSSNDDERDQSDSMLHDAFVAKYDSKNNSANDMKNVNHPTNCMPIHLHSNNNNNNNNNSSSNNHNGIPITHSAGKNAIVNSRAAHCNLSPTTGANVIKQKISLLRRVCKHTAKKRSTSNCSSPTSPCTDGHLYFDGNRSIKAVSV